jgi:hypothetical protein
MFSHLRGASFFLLAAGWFAPFTYGAPISYTIAFSSPGLLLPTSGSFNYDPVNQQFSAFTVVWNSITFNLTARANVGPTTFTGTGCGIASSPVGLFTLLNGNSLCSTPRAGWIASGNINGTDEFSFFTIEGGNVASFIADFTPINQPSTSAFGNFSIVVAIPEPAPFWLIGIGLAGLFLASNAGKQRYEVASTGIFVRKPFG